MIGRTLPGETRGMAVAIPAGMRTHQVFPVLTVAAFLLLLGAGPLAAQDPSTPPARGKIDGVEREADTGGAASADDDGGSFLDFAWDVLGFLGRAAKGHGQGYQRYPWAGPDSDPFVLRDVAQGRRFYTLSAAGFDDAGSTTTGRIMAFEMTKSEIQLELEYVGLRERTQTDVDRLHLLRAGLSVVPRTGANGFVRLGAAGRSIILDDGRAAGGPELEIGGQYFPARPLGIDVRLRGALLAWDAGSAFTMLESITTASVFVGRVEVVGGWRWTKIEAVPAFGGPTVGVRLWF